MVGFEGSSVVAVAGECHIMSFENGNKQSPASGKRYPYLRPNFKDPETRTFSATDEGEGIEERYPLTQVQTKGSNEIKRGRRGVARRRSLRFAQFEPRVRG